MGNILLIEDERNVRYALKRVLQEAGFSVIDVEDPKDVTDLKDFNLLILDLKLKTTSGIDFLKDLRERGINLPVIVITAYANPENIISASRYGVIDILKKPFSKEELLELVNRLMKEETPALKVEVDPQRVIVGESERMMEVFKKVGLAAATDMNVLLTGETGVGKDLLARIIHENSARKDHPFVAINCSAIPENLLEAELFGYRKGAFTGALRDTKGKIEAAEGGTLFLDEIGDMPYSLQSKILRFLETRSFYRLGDDRERKANVRIIAATNRDLSRMIGEGKFREDLYYRLSQIVIEVPPLRERREDIPKLIEFFINKANEEFGTEVRGVTEGALKEAMDYEWKGNVRELKNVVYKAVLETKSGYIESLNLSGPGKEDLEGLITRCVEITPEEDLKSLVLKVERKVLEHLMTKYRGNKSRVAQILGMSRNTLKTKLKKYGVWQ